jgi:hypothetical protein
MKSVVFEPRLMDQLLSSPEESPTEWIWNGMIARGNITILTSQWKAGKTTLLAGLLRALETGGTFLDLPCIAAKSLVVSEESVRHWAARQKTLPIGPHTRLVSRPFIGRPTPEQWDELIRHAEAERAAGALDVLVVDPLATFLPGRSDSDPGTLLDMLNPLRRLAEYGAAVFILHHPRKERSEEGSSARGSGALLGFVDIILEMTRHGRLSTDRYRRKITGFSRHLETPASLVYEWIPGSVDFQPTPDTLAMRYQENWPVVESLLTQRSEAATHKELLTDWPPEESAPSASQLYVWLTQAVAEKRVIRSGSGTRGDPYRFRLYTKADVRRLEAIYDLISGAVKKPPSDNPDIIMEKPIS